MRPPGTRALRLARRWFGRAAANRIFEPLVADWEHDVRSRTSGPARMAAGLRWTLSFCCTALVIGLGMALPRYQPGTWLRSPLATIVASAGAATALLLSALSFQAWQELTPAMFRVLGVEAAKVALPLALAPAAVLLARCGFTAYPERRWRLGGMTLLVLLAQFGIVGWVGPTFARLERQERNERTPVFAAFPDTPATLRFDELLRPSQSHEPLSLSTYARHQELWNRIVWVVWPAAVVVFGWRLGRHRVASHRRTGVAAASWALSLAALMTPMVLMSWLVPGSPFGSPSLVIRFLPCELLIVAAFLLPPSPLDGDLVPPRQSRGV